MKRRRQSSHSLKSDRNDSDNDNVSRKIIKVDSQLVNLPTDIIKLIFDHLSNQDITNLSVVNRYFRQNLQPYVFSKIKTTWHKLIQEFSTSKSNFFHKYYEFINQIRIIDCYSYGEWQIDIFDEYLSQLPNLTHLLLNSNTSSNWLKYRHSDNLTQLSLYFEKDHFETLAISQSKTATSATNFHPNPHQMVSPRIFNINHIKHFNRLRKLNLNTYHFIWEEGESTSFEEILIHLVELNLVNCSWEYPFKLSQFNTPTRALKILTLHYFNNNSFILSERFNEFLLNIEENFQSLSKLQMIIDHDEEHNYDRYNTFEMSWDRRLPSNIFDKIMNKNYFPYLKKVKFWGWYINLNNLNNTVRKLKLDEINDIEVIDLNRVNTPMNGTRITHDDYDNDMIIELTEKLMNYSVKLISN